VAYGIGLDGKRQLLAVTVGAEESEDSWSELLAQLVERGLFGVQLVVADAHAGLAKAVRHHLPEAPLQRCTVATGSLGYHFHRFHRGPGSDLVVGHGDWLHRAVGPERVLPA